jgi:hypothetical protein
MNTCPVSVSVLIVARLLQTGTLPTARKWCNAKEWRGGEGRAWGWEFGVFDDQLVEVGRAWAARGLQE